MSKATPTRRSSRGHVVSSASIKGWTMPPATDSPDLVRFGVFEVDVCAGEPRKRGMRLTIQGLPSKVLVTLMPYTPINNAD